MATLPFMTVKAGESVVSIHRGCRIGAHVETSGSFEPETLAAWDGLMQAGKTAIDVGAYTGVFSIVAAMRGAKAVAIEPMPEQRQRMRKNVSLNGVQVMVIPAAASDQTGHAQIRYQSRVQLTSAAAINGIKGDASMTVNTFRLDELNLNDVCAIKIDAERHEAEVIRGAQVLIRRFKPAIIAECLDDELRQRVIRELKGYRIAKILDIRNLLFLPHDLRAV